MGTGIAEGEKDSEGVDVIWTIAMTPHCLDLALFDTDMTTMAAMMTLKMQQWWQ